MEYKYDNSDVRAVSYVILKDKDLANLPIKNDTFNDGGITRVMEYLGMVKKFNTNYVATGYREKRVNFLYEPDVFDEALIGLFIFVAN